MIFFEHGICALFILRALNMRTIDDESKKFEPEAMRQLQDDDDENNPRFSRDG